MTMIPMIQQGDIIPRSPSSQLRLYSGVPWDNKYEHVRLYNSQSDLLSNLETWRVTPSTQLSNLTPIRVGDYEVRVPLTEMTALNINYAAFQNTGISNTWVFCFVTGIRWRSENTTILELEIDVFQNNFYNITMKPCFIEYSHIPKSADAIGANLYPVNLESGENYCANYAFKLYNPKNICMYVSEKTTGQHVDGSIVNNIYRAGSLEHSTLASEINELIDTYEQQGKTDAIMSLFMSPDLCLDAELNPGEEEDSYTATFNTANFFEGYTPKNNKLYQYPFIYLLVDNNEGTSLVLRYEYSDNDDHSIQFSIVGCLCTTPQILCTPINYNGYAISYVDSLTMSAFPQCAFNSDVYKAWLAQNRATIALATNKAYDDITISALQSLGGAATAIGGAAAGSPGIMATGAQMAQGANLISTARNSLYTIQGIDAMKMNKAVLPPNVHGKVMNDNINAARNLNSFNFYTMSCRREYAEQIDSYFDKFGYPINKIQQPNITSRSTWNYIKTQDCGFTGSVELGELAQIRAIFNNGVTIWHTNDIGNYSLTNN